MTENWFISFGINLVMIIFILLIRTLEGSFFAPGSFFALIWFGYILLSLLLAPDYNMHPLGVVGIWGAVLAVVTGSMLASGRPLQSVSTLLQKRRKYICFSKNQNLNLFGLSHLTFFSSLLGLGAVVVLILSSGYSLSSLISLNSLAEMGHKFAVNRYLTTTFREPSLAIFLTSFIYFGGFLGGTLYATSPNNFKKIIAMLPIVVSIMHGMVLTTRASIFFTSIIWISSYISSNIIITKGAYSLFTFRKIFTIIGGSVVAVIIYMFLQILRWGVGSLTDMFTIISETIPFVYSAFLAPPATFSQWFAQHWQDDIIPTFGASTSPFLKLFGLFGITTHQIRHEAILVGTNLLRQESTTVFTLFRDLIEDYTLIGAILFLFSTGIIAGWAYRKILQGRVIYLPIIAAFYAVTIDSLTGCLFRYTTISFAWSLFFFYFILIHVDSNIYHIFSKKIIRRPLQTRFLNKWVKNI